MKQGQQKANLSDDDRNKLAQHLLLHSTNGQLHYGANKKACELFNMDAKTIYRIWKQAAAQQSMGKPIHLKTMKKGSKHKDKKHLDEEKLKSLSVLERASIRKIAIGMGVSKFQVQMWLKQKRIRHHTNAIRPFLTPTNMLKRLEFSLNQLSCVSEEGQILFKNLYTVIHIDEKWFNITNTNGKYYVLLGEEEPYRTCKSKTFIEKIMFECMVSRPIIDSTGKVIFDGKFGIIPFTYEEPAQRNSKNRERGTMITKPVQAITRPVMKQLMLQQMLPIIMDKWPEGISKNIIIQQDNAKPHIDNSDPDFRAAASANGFNIQLVCQPPNSPDTNINDLAFFRAIQTLKDEMQAKTVDDMIKNVIQAFEIFPAWKLNNVFLTLQSCHQEIIRCKGGNNYKIPHLGKEKMMRDGELPESLTVDEAVVREGWEYLKMHNIEGGEIFKSEDLTAGVEQMVLTD